MRKSTFVDDLRDFLSFLQSLWGVLSGITLLFPLSNLFVNVIPLQDDYQPLARLSPAPIAATATLVSLFILLSIFNERQQLMGPELRHLRRRQAAISLAIALVALAAYLVGNDLVQAHLYGDTSHTTILSESRLLAGDVVFSCLYIAFFALATRAFLLIALLEYVNPASTTADGEG